MMPAHSRFAIFVVLTAMVCDSTLTAHDPCGMVPPIYTGGKVPISRIGLQQTYVFYKDGVETFVIRPGFTGNVDNFGMLIPFPSAPALRKVPDEIFPHIDAAIDPPEVVIDCRPVLENRTAAFNMQQNQGLGILKKSEVRVLREEAVGMYEVAVLEAGSADALKKWMDVHGYQYPTGMDKVCAEYIELAWCFVAVKTRVGTKQGVDPKPGQRQIDNQMPGGASFDGHVQGMGFRFKTDKLVVPMRLSAFNAGELRNVVYLLTDGPKKIRAIPEEYVVRQLNGEQLYNNVTQPLPVRILNGTFADIPQWERETLNQRRDPYQKNGAAKELFASDLIAVSSGEMSLQHEEQEKELLRIGEHFGLRGPEIDEANALALKENRDEAVSKGLDMVKQMTMTVVDGDFPREVIAGQNLTFAEYKMPAQRNKPELYDATLHGPAPKREGILKTGAINWRAIDRLAALSNDKLTDRPKHLHNHVSIQDRKSADQKISAQAHSTNRTFWLPLSIICAMVLVALVGSLHKLNNRTTCK